MEALYNPKAHSDSRVYCFTDRDGEEIGLYLMTQASTRVASIKFMSQQKKIPIPFGILISIIDPQTGAVLLNASGTDGVVWFHAKHQFRVQYFGLPVCVGDAF